MSVDFMKWGNGNWDNEEDARDNFESYFHYHYKPLLKKLSETQYPKIDLSDEDFRLLHFTCDDFLKIFHGDENETE